MQRSRASKRQSLIYQVTCLAWDRILPLGAGCGSEPGLYNGGGNYLDVRVGS